jgi:undecaprenyl-diphosphatase
MNYKAFQIINGWSGLYFWLDQLMIFTSQYALVLFALWLVFMWFRGKDHTKRSVLYAGFTGILALFVNFIIGHVYLESRPFVIHSVHLLYPHAADASFPSDHTTGAFALAIMIILRNRGVGAWGYGMLMLAILTGISRVYVGHHYPGDVLGSVAVAIITSILIYKFKEHLEPITKRIVNRYEMLLNKKKD